MKYAPSFLFAAAAVLAQDLLQFTAQPSSVTVGEPVNLEWTGGDDSPVTITLRRGESRDLETIDVITGSATGNSFTWTPQEDLDNGDDYTLQISQGVDESNFSGRFAISGGSGSDDDSSSSTGSASSSGSAATSSGTVTVTATNTTTTASHTITRVASSSGTGITVPRNTTFVSQSLTATTETETETATTTAEETSAEETAAQATESGNGASYLSAQVGAGFAAVLGLAAII